MLRLFSDVRGGEGFTALLLMSNLFLLLTAYLIIKVVREALILGEGGAVVKSYAAAGQALLLLGVVPLYSVVASRVRRIQLINGVTSFCILVFFLFYLLGRLGFALGVPFFLWVGIFNLFVIAQFWSFANDLYSEEQGKRLFRSSPLAAALARYSDRSWRACSTNLSAPLDSCCSPGRSYRCASSSPIGSIDARRSAKPRPKRQMFR